MINYIEKKRLEFPKLTEIIRFLIIGGLATIIDMLVMFFITYLPYKGSYASITDAIKNPITPVWLIVVATAAGFLVGLVFNYVFSIHYVYQNDNKKAKTPKAMALFAVLSAIGLAIQTLGMLLFNGLFGVNEWLVKVVLIVVVLVFNYITRKKFIFNKSANLEAPAAEKLQADQQNAAVETETAVLAQKEKLTVKTIALNIWFILSSICFMLLCRMGKLESHATTISVVVLLAVFGLLLFVFEKNLLLKIKRDNKVVNVMTILFAIFMLSVAYRFGLNTELKHKALFLIGGSFAAFVYSYFISLIIYHLVSKFVKSITRSEKKLFWGVVIAFVALALTIDIFTRLMVFPPRNDAFFGLDTYFYTSNIFNTWKAETDFRHYLMIIVQYPILVVPYLVQLLFPVPQVVISLIYQFEQIFLLAIIAILVKRMFAMHGVRNPMVSTVVLMTAFSIICNTLTAEKFIISLFYIVLTLYFTMNNSDFKWLFFVMAVGALTTNVFLIFIVLFYNKTTMKKFITEAAAACFIYLMFIVIFGYVERVLDCPNQIKWMLRYSSLEKEISFVDKIYQFFIFIAALFTFPPYRITQFNSYMQANVSFNAYVVVGMIILAICLVSVILNRKNKLARLCLYWIVFMFALLVLLGWGSSANEMFIYSSIFVIPVFALLVLFFEKLFKGKCLAAITIILVTTLCIHNIIQMVDFINFSKVAWPGILPLLK